jgi:ketosteroid isomerase-like protein
MTAAFRAAVARWGIRPSGAFDAEFSLAPEEVQIAGPDWAFERGTYDISLTPKAGGEPMQDAGKYITIYRRQSDGSWAMSRDIWNSSNPVPGMPG